MSLYSGVFTVGHVVPCVYCIDVLYFILYLGKLSDWMDCNSVGHPVPESSVDISNSCHMSVNNLSSLKSQNPNNSSIHLLEDDPRLCRLTYGISCLLHLCL